MTFFNKPPFFAPIYQRPDYSNDKRHKTSSDKSSDFFFESDTVEFHVGITTTRHDLRVIARPRQLVTRRGRRAVTTSGSASSASHIPSVGGSGGGRGHRCDRIERATTIAGHITRTDSNGDFQRFATVSLRWILLDFRFPLDGGSDATGIWRNRGSCGRDCGSLLALHGRARRNWSHGRRQTAAVALRCVSS